MSKLNVLVSNNLGLYGPDKVLAIENSIRAYLQNEHDFVNVIEELIEKSAHYKSMILHERPQLVKPDFDKNENKKDLQSRLKSVQTTKQFLENQYIQVQILNDINKDSLPFAETYEVVNAAIALIEKQIAAASHGGRPVKWSRDYLIRNIFKIWKKYTGKDPTVTTEALSEKGRKSAFVVFAEAAALPILIDGDGDSLDSALIAMQRQL